MPQNAQGVNATITASKSVVNLSAANAGAQLKSGKGVLNGVVVGTGASGASVAFYDGTSTAGTPLGTFAATAQFGVAGLGIPFNTGLFVVVTNAPNVTVSFT